jgi:hypothetical protein
MMKDVKQWKTIELDKRLRRNSLIKEVKSLFHLPSIDFTSTVLSVYTVIAKGNSGVKKSKCISPIFMSFR